jgi:predicted RNase H-like HicB family nuclease
VNLEKDGKWLIVSFTDIPEGHSNGTSLEDALAMATDALAAAISFYFDRSEAVPMPTKPKAGQHTDALPLSVSAKVLLWNEMIRQNVKTRRTGAAHGNLAASRAAIDRHPACNQNRYDRRGHGSSGERSAGGG